MNKPLSIAYLGSPGSFSHSAGISHYGPASQFISYPNFAGVFGAVEKGVCAGGVVPLENSLAGSIYENYDLLKGSKLSIAGEVLVKVEHHLCTVSGSIDSETVLKGITHLYSHPKAFEQVSRFVTGCSGVKQVATSDTATAAQMVSELGDPRHAAICSETAADLNGLTIIKRNLEDDPLNFTRFAVLSAETSAADDADKCSLQLILPHIPKSLFKTLEVIVSVALNTSKIESRPIPGKPFEYVFYIDFEFEPADREAIDQMLERLRQTVKEMKILGFYHRAERDFSTK